MNESRIRTLLLYADYTTRLSYYDDWLEAFVSSADFDCDSINICAAGARRRAAREIGAYDLVALLHSTNADTLVYIEPLRHALTARRGDLVVFVGNESSHPGSPMAKKLAFLRAVESDYVASGLPLDIALWLYAGCARKGILALPHALNPSVFVPTLGIADRQIDIGVRAAIYAPYLGDEDRNRMLRFFATADLPLVRDIDLTGKRLDRTAWADFLGRCKGTVTTEAGPSFLEKDDRTMNAIRAYVEEIEGRRGGMMIRIDSPLRRLGHKLPPQLRELLRRFMHRGPLRHEAAVFDTLDFDDVHERFFRPYSGKQVSGKCISSRHFDAIGTKTCQVMFPGRFNDILVADEHYVALQRDFKNLEDVLQRFRSLDYRQKLVDRTYDYVMAAHTYGHRTSALYRHLTA